MEHVAEGYAKVKPLAFAEVGAGSDIAAVRRALPGVFLNARFSPVSLKELSEAEITEKTKELLRACDQNMSVSCVGIDAGVDHAKICAFLTACMR